MLAELILTATVQAEAESVLPGSTAAAASAVRQALCAYIGGASTGEAAAVARRYLKCVSSREQPPLRPAS
jgi:hypothetical protein